MKGVDLTDRQDEWSDWIDAQDVCSNMHISQRTLQTWRIEGLLPFSRIKGKLYYRKSDIFLLLKENYNGDLRRGDYESEDDEKGGMNASEM